MNPSKISINGEVIELIPYEIEKPNPAIGKMCVITLENNSEISIPAELICEIADKIRGLPRQYAPKESLEQRRLRVLREKDE